MAFWRKKKEENLEQKIGVEIVTLWKLFTEIREASGTIDATKEIDDLMRSMTSILPFWAYSGSEKEKRRKLEQLRLIVQTFRKKLKKLKIAKRLVDKGELDEEYLTILKDDLVTAIHALAQLAAGNVLEPAMNRPIIINKPIAGGKDIEINIEGEEEEEENEEERKEVHSDKDHSGGKEA